MIARLKAALEGAQSVALVCHLSPDMDTLGSAVALRYILEAQGKRAVVYDQDEVPERYLFLEGLDAVRRPDDEVYDLPLPWTSRTRRAWARRPGSLPRRAAAP